MKLLFGSNISRRIVRLLDDLFPGSSQVTLLGLSGETPDETIWSIATKREYTIVSADIDFVQIAARLGSPPKVIRLERMDYSTAEAAALIRRNAILIAEFERSEKGILILRRP